MNASIALETFWDIATRLLLKTKAGEVAWRMDRDFRDTYFVRLPHSVIAISSGPVNPSPTGCTLEIRDLKNQAIERWAVPGRLDPDFQLLLELFEEASRAASSSDAIEDVTAALNSEGPIG